MHFVFSSSMKHSLFLLLFCGIFAIAQNSIKATLVDSRPFKADSIIAIDNFESLYYISNNTFHKKYQGKDINYANVLLGNLSSANTFNPLKINLFYKDFNTVIILDNRLAEIFKIDFNTKQPYKNVSHVSTGFDNNIWIFNQDLFQLELYDYKTNTTKAATMPIQSTVLDLKSNYNYCWLLTEDYFYTYTYTGSLLSKVKNEGFTTMGIVNETLILKKGNQLYFLKNGQLQFHPIALPQLLIKQFLLTNQTLYIYDKETLTQFHLKID
ncbi:hypothetical protein [Mangrovimonas sp. TPBH4]|uniref:hypothetical protein n=1 Tax=Mangrovimonas sp. TPBH4 TaxID=1645914 RepID=UPI000A46F49B|nr:hypothetical protein [Mangrovimonas sp. TPBH4]